MFAVCGTVELGLDVDAGCGRKREAMADVNVAFGWRGEGCGFGIYRSRIAGFDGGVTDFADRLQELPLGKGFGFGQSCVALESKGVDGFAVRIAGGDLAGGGYLEG